MRSLLTLRSDPKRVYLDPARGASPYRVSYRLQGGNYGDGEVLSAPASGITDDWSYRDYELSSPAVYAQYTGFSVTENDEILLVTGLELAAESTWTLEGLDVVQNDADSVEELVTVLFDDVQGNPQSIEIAIFPQTVSPSTVSTVRMPDLESDPVSGSASRAVWQAMKDLAAAANADTALARALFTTEDDVTPTYVRNPDCWLASIAAKLTSESPWNSRGGKLRSGVLVADDIALFARHFPVQVGDTVRFVNAANQVFDYVVEAKKTTTVESYTLQSETTSTVETFVSDVLVVKFTENVDASIYRTKLFSSPTDPYFPMEERFRPNVREEAKGVWAYRASSVQVPVILTRKDNTVNAARGAVAGEFNPGTGTSRFSGNWVWPGLGGADLQRLEASVVGGDSGSISWILIDGELVAHALAWRADGTAFALHYFAPKIEAAMSAMGSVANLSYFDLSGYPAYPYSSPTFADNIVT